MASLINFLMKKRHLIFQLTVIFQINIVKTSLT